MSPAAPAFRSIVLCLLWLLPLAGRAAPPFALMPARAVAPSAARQIDWDALLPATERGHVAHTPPPPIHDYLGEGSPAALQTGSYAVNRELDGVRVRVPGFVVPLTLSSDGVIHEFLLVPYFGACIHVPPPPPNQIIYVKMRGSTGPQTMSEALWIIGTLRTQVTSSPLAAAAYRLDADSLEPYQYTQP
jgi:hypothetical protein